MQEKNNNPAITKMKEWSKLDDSRYASADEERRIKCSKGKDRQRCKDDSAAIL